MRLRCHARARTLSEGAPLPSPLPAPQRGAHERVRFCTAIGTLELAPPGVAPRLHHPPCRAVTLGLARDRAPQRAEPLPPAHDHVEVEVAHVFGEMAELVADESDGEREEPELRAGFCVLEREEEGLCGDAGAVGDDVDEAVDDGAACEVVSFTPRSMG